MAAAETGAAECPGESDIRIFAMALLARREFGVSELQARLLRKWAACEGAEEIIAAAVAGLEQDGLVSDQRFAASFIRSRVQRLQGPVKVRSELRSRRVPDPVVAEAMLEHEDAWTQRAADWLDRHAPAELDYAGRAKYYRRLINRGFTHEQASGALAVHAGQARPSVD